MKHISLLEDLDSLKFEILIVFYKSKVDFFVCWRRKEHVPNKVHAL